MKQFNVVKYLKKYRWLIFLMALAGALLVFVYAVNKQTYTASMQIRYSGGKVPEDLRVVYSPDIIDAALMELDYDADVDKVRSRFRVDPVIPEDDQTMIEAQLERGLEPDYTPDTYRVVYVDENEERARNILDAVIKNYYSSYTEQFADEQLQENGTISLLDGSNDYLDSAEVLETVLNDMLTFLSRKQEAQPDVRSIHTGCSYQDLYEAFKFIYDNELPALYNEIVSTAQSKDVEVLRTRLRKEISDLIRHLGHVQQQIDLLNTLINNFTAQTSEIEAYRREDSASGEAGNVLGAVEDTSGKKRTTTYDGLMEQYVDLRSDYERTEVDLAHKRFLLAAFGGEANYGNYAPTPDVPVQLPAALTSRGEADGLPAEEPGEPDEAAEPEVPEVPVYDAVNEAKTPEEISAHIAHIIAAFNNYYELTDKTCAELNSVLSASYLTTVSSISTHESIHLVRYAVIALVLFLIIGVVVAILLGRGVELVEGMLYVDRTVDLPNRARCDLYLEKNGEKLLPENYSCIVWNLQLRRISERFGRQAGDAVLKDFAHILKSFEELYGFIAHNGGGQFFAFFEDCSRKRVDAIRSVLKEEAKKYNEMHENEIMLYSEGCAITSEDSEYQLRPLMRLAMQRQIHGEGAGKSDAKTAGDVVQ